MEKLETCHNWFTGYFMFHCLITVIYLPDNAKL